jgi:hypothetical protein
MEWQQHPEYDTHTANSGEYTAHIGICIPHRNMFVETPKGIVYLKDAPVSWSLELCKLHLEFWIETR